MLWLAWHFPDLSLEVFTRGGAASEPLVVSDRPGREQKVWRANAAARRRGIRAGMRVSAALALQDGLRVIARDERAEQRALRRLAAWSCQYSSLIHIAPHQVLLLEIGGSLRLFGELDRLVRHMAEGLGQLGYTARWAVAPTRLAAAWFARTRSETRITERRHLMSALSQLPLTVLDLPARSLQRLRGMGVRRLGECLRLPREGLARRLGPEFIVLLDRARGDSPDPQPNFIPEACFDSRLELPAALDNVEGLVFGLRRLVAELCGELRGRGAGVMQLQLSLHHPRLARSGVELRLIAPTREPQHLMRLFNERLAQVELSEPVEAISLHAPAYSALDATDLDLFDTRSRSSRQCAAALIERLRARLGEQAVQGLQAVAEHRPERAYRLRHDAKAAPAIPTGARPLWLLPEPVLLAQEQGRPRLGGALVLKPDAERIESGWWDGADVRRDYFVAHNPAGEYYWIFRELRPPHRWWLHGVFG